VIQNSVDEVAGEGERTGAGAGIGRGDFWRSWAREAGEGAERMRRGRTWSRETDWLEWARARGGTMQGAAAFCSSATAKNVQGLRATILRALGVLRSEDKPDNEAVQTQRLSEDKNQHHTDIQLSLLS